MIGGRSADTAAMLSLISLWMLGSSLCSCMRAFSKLEGYVKRRRPGIQVGRSIAKWGDAKECQARAGRTCLAETMAVWRIVIPRPVDKDAAPMGTQPRS